VVVLVLLTLFVGAILAPKYGTDSRPGFTGRPDWRGRGA
jgi:hypothetical protein